LRGPGPATRPHDQGVVPRGGRRPARRVWLHGAGGPVLDRAGPAGVPEPDVWAPPARHGDRDRRGPAERVGRAGGRVRKGSPPPTRLHAQRGTPYPESTGVTVGILRRSAIAGTLRRRAPTDGREDH